MTRRMHRAPAPTLAPASLAVLLVAVALGACTAGGPVTAPTAVVTPSSDEGAVSPGPAEVSPSATPEPVVLHPEGRVGDLPVNAPAADVVAHLTERLGPAPRTLDAEFACEPAGEPGRLLAWRGLRVFVLTTDAEGRQVDPYVGGWSLLDEGGADPSLGTAEGLQTGDPTERITALYPRAEGNEWLAEHIWRWQTEPGGGYVVMTEDDGLATEVTAIGSGFECSVS